MNLTIQQHRKLKTAGLLLLAGMVLGAIFTSFSQGFNSLYPSINAVIIGVSVALLVAIKNWN